MAKKAKVKRQDTTIDMTAMCVVTFLLLTFFVLTAQARQEETLMVDTPASTTQDKLPDDNMVIITEGDEEKEIYSIKDLEVRKKTLENINDKYGISFSEEEYEKFRLTEDFSVPIENLRQLLSLDKADIDDTMQSGIPVDSTEDKSNELYHWVQQSRLATVS